MSRTVTLQGNLTFDCNQMERDTMSTSTKSIEKVKAGCQAVDPTTFDWSSVDMDTWFMCFTEGANQRYSGPRCYYFPIGESENRDDNYARVKSGMAHFISKGWFAYKIQ